jgi:hypothetical protein
VSLQGKTSSPQAVAQRALDDAQTAFLVDDDIEGLQILCSALKYIASKGKVYGKRWDGLRKEPE